MQHNMAQLVGSDDPLFLFGEISVDPDEILPQEIARKSLGAVQVKIETDLYVHGIQQLKGIPGPVLTDQLLCFLIDIKPAHSKTPPQTAPPSGPSPL